MDPLDCWRHVQDGDSPMLGFAKARIPTPIEAYPYLKTGDPFNCKLQVLQWVDGSTPHYRAIDSQGNKIYVETSPSPHAPPLGSIVHFHHYVIFAFHEDVILLKTCDHSAHRVSWDQQDWLALEICGSTGSMLEAAALIGFLPYATVEINQTAVALSKPRHRVICADATDFKIYTKIPNIHILLQGFPCQSFALHGTGKGETVKGGILAALGPIVSCYLGCKSYILETVPGFTQMVASHRSLDNLQLISQACQYYMSNGDMHLETCWVQHRHRYVLVGDRRMLPKTFYQAPSTAPLLSDLPIIKWDMDLEMVPEDCWPDVEELEMIHDRTRVPFNYNRYLSQKSPHTHPVMRGYATYLPAKNKPYLSQVVIIPEGPVASAPAAVRANLQQQIANYGFPVRYLTPEEAVAITGILPQVGPTKLVWELAGNACSPFLLFEALRLIVSPDTATAFPVKDLRRAWSRKLGLPMKVVLGDAFPPPINSALFVQFKDDSKIMRTHEESPMEIVLDMAAAIHGLDKGDYIICSLVTSIPVPLSSKAGEWFGSRLWLCETPSTPRT